jgi:hypothetical protein
VASCTIDSVDFLVNSVTPNETFNQQGVKGNDNIWPCGHYLGDAQTEIEVNTKDVKAAYALDPTAAVPVVFSSSDKATDAQGTGTFTYSNASLLTRGSNFETENPTEVTLPFQCAASDGVTNPLSVVWVP